MTRPPMSGILQMDSDGLVSYHYTRTVADGTEIPYRKVLFSVKGDRVFTRDPETKEDVLVGRFARGPEGIMFIILM